MTRGMSSPRFVILSFSTATCWLVGEPSPCPSPERPRNPKPVQAAAPRCTELFQAPHWVYELSGCMCWESPHTSAALGEPVLSSSLSTGTPPQPALLLVRGALAEGSSEASLVTVHQVFCLLGGMPPLPELWRLGPPSRAHPEDTLSKWGSHCPFKLCH